MNNRMPTVEQQQQDWLRVAELALDMASFAPEANRLRDLTLGPDGYPSGGGGRRGPGAISDSTCAAVIAALESPVDDRVATLLTHLFAQTEAMQAAARKLAGIVRLIEKRGDARYGRQATVIDCLACETSVSGVGEDRIRGGYCPKCHRAWLRYRLAEQLAGRDPVHESFRRRRQREKVAS